MYFHLGMLVPDSRLPLTHSAHLSLSPSHVPGALQDVITEDSRAGVDAEVCR